MGVGASSATFQFRQVLFVPLAANSGSEPMLTDAAACTNVRWALPSCLASLVAIDGFRLPREIIAYPVWAHCRFALSTADGEDLLANRV